MLEVPDTLLRTSVDGLAQAVVVNTSRFTQRVVPGTVMGQAELLQSQPVTVEPASFAEEQRKDPRVLEILQFLETGEFPTDQQCAWKLAPQEHLFVLRNHVLYHLNQKQNNCKQVVVPEHMRVRIMEENHHGPMPAHFLGHRLFSVLVNTGGGRVCTMIHGSM